MTIKLKQTQVEIMPSEDIGYICAMILTNELITATLKLTRKDVIELIDALLEYKE